MLLNKHNLDVADFCSKEESRYTLQAILVDQDGTTATDGHALVNVTLPKVEEKNFPCIPGVTPSNGETKMLLSRDAAKDIAKAIPRKNVIPILNHAIVGKPDTSDGIATAYKIAVTDLDNPKVFTPKPVTGQFPNWKMVIPNGDPSPVLTIGFNAELLASVLRGAAKFSDSRSHHVTLSFYGPEKAVKIETENADTGQKWTGVVMPCRK